MNRSVKVYGWYGHRRECPPAANGSRQTREIVAASSIAGAMRLTGERRSNLWDICETGNQHEIETAMAEPGVVFWKPLYNYKSGGWTAVRPATPAQGVSG